MPQHLLPVRDSAVRNFLHTMGRKRKVKHRPRSRRRTQPRNPPRPAPADATATWRRTQREHGETALFRFDKSADDSSCAAVGFKADRREGPPDSCRSVVGHEVEQSAARIQQGKANPFREWIRRRTLRRPVRGLSDFELWMRMGTHPGGGWKPIEYVAALGACDERIGNGRRVCERANSSGGNCRSSWRNGASVRS